VIFCLIILNISLYDVKYKCILNIKIYLKVKVLDHFFYLKKLHSLCMYMLGMYLNYIYIYMHHMKNEW
jgi:hypothetical protein